MRRARPKFDRRALVVAAMLLLGMAGGAVPAAAQMSELSKLGATSPESRADFLTEQMKSDLTLTAEQVPEVSALNLKYTKLQQPLLEAHGSTFSRAREIKKLNSQKETALRALISDAQWQAYEQNRDALKANLEAWASTHATTPTPKPTP